jgi:hypothetical protein
MSVHSEGMTPWCASFAIALLLASTAAAQTSAGRLVFTVQPSTTAAEATIRPAVSVTVQDASGQTVTSFTGAVTLAITDETGGDESELSGRTTVAALAGVATFSDLSINQAAGGYTLTATATGFAEAASAAFDITTAPTTQATRHVGAAAGPTTRLMFTVQPSTTAAGATIRPAVEVTVRDSVGQTARSYTGDVTLEIADGAGADEAELTGALTVAAVAGVARFSTLSIDVEADGYTLTATAPGLADVTSAAFDVTAGAKRMLHATARSSDVALDGRLDEPSWSTADSIANLTTIEPEEGGVPAGQTTVKVLVNAGEIVFGVMCRDANPAGIISFSKARDSDLEFEDHVLIVLDPFQDGRSGYVFAVNPSGARFDGLVSAQGEEVNAEWDAVWEARTWRDASGWSAEIRIPIRSLSFRKGLTGWGLNVQRRVQRLQETSRWAGASRDYEIYQTSRAGLLTDLPEFDFGLGLSVRPALAGNASRSGPAEDRVYKSEGSLDATKKLGPNLVGSLTVNTDFGETEVDARQTNLTRFDLIFPEKRTFFLEGADIFEFGLGTGEDLVPFHSRRIGLQGEEEDLIEIPLTVGGKLNGRVGNTNLGALAVRTRRAGSLTTDATMGAVRVKQNILSESSVGMIATFGDPLAQPGSWMGGADFTYQTSEFRGDKNLLVGAWGLLNHGDDLGGDQAFGGMIDYPNDLWDVAMTYKHIGEDFNPSLGFVPRTGVQIWQGEAAFNPRPNWPLVRQMFFELNPLLVTDLGGRWESYLVTIKPLDWQLESGDRFEFTFEPQGDRPSEDFDVFASNTNSVTVPAGSYRWTRYSLQGALAAKRRISGEATGSLGGFYGGDLKSLGLTLRVKPSAYLTAELGWERNSGQLPQGDFTQHLYSGRVQLNVSPDLQVASFLQYDNESRSFGTNSRLRWTFNPLGDLFVVFNHNMLRDIDDRFTFDSNQLLVKLQYAYRL